MKIFSEKNKIIRYARTWLPVWRPKRIGFYENFGHGDLGDDTSFYVAEELLAEPLLPMSKRCHVFHPGALKGLLVGGRGVFHSECPYVPRQLLQGKKFPFPVVLFGAGVNCDYDRDVSSHTIDTVKRLCAGCDHISVRDEASRRFLDGLGVKGVRIMPDLELVVRSQPTELPETGPGPCVGITVTPHGAFGPGMVGRITSNFTALVRYLTEKGYGVVFFCFDQSASDSRRERRIIDAIVRDVPLKNRIFVLERDLMPGEMLFAIQELCDVMVCMRLHSMVFAANAGLPFLPVGFNRMHTAFLDMLGLSDREISVFERFSPDDLVDGFDRLIDDQARFEEVLHTKVPVLRADIRREAASIRALFPVEGSGERRSS